MFKRWILPLHWINPYSQDSAYWFSKCLSVLDGNLSRGQINLYYAVLDSATGLLSTIHWIVISLVNCVVQLLN